MSVPSHAGQAMGAAAWETLHSHHGVYRPDIDGLRAVAVLSVVVCHFWPHALPGGFVGVDVFFVISGYLITQILARELAEGRFRVAEFYARRARRLFPALFTVLAATFALGIVVMLPTDMADMLRALVATVFFSANLMFWRESTSYFAATESLDNPLLHLWSLGVEEQFYLFFPWLLVAAFAWARYRGGHPQTLLRWGLLVLTVAGLVLASVMTHKSSTAAFYLSPLRAWEFMMGALAALLPAWGARSRALRQGLAVLSLSVLLACVLLYSPHTRFPGWAALPPVLATAVLLHGGGMGHAVARLLATPALVGVGLVSYSLYLWHWPVLVLARHWQGMVPSPWWDPALLALAGVLSVLTWHFVEQPWRRPAAVRPAQGPVWAAASALTLVMLGGLGLLQQGMAWRVPVAVRTLDAARDDTRIPFKACADRATDRLCLLGDPGARPSMLLWGDSHMLAWAPALDKALLDAGRSALLAPQLACAPLAGMVNTQVRRCAQASHSVMDFLQAHPGLQTVVLAAHWSHYFREQSPSRMQQGPLQGLPAVQQALRSTVSQLTSNGRELVLIGPVPTLAFNVPQALALQAWHGRLAPVITAADVAPRQELFWKAASELSQWPQVRLIDPVAWLCRPHCMLAHEGQSLYRDEQHLGDWGARMASPWLARALGLAASPIQP